jgi:N-acetylglutamate synthase-like GNAT family acetyltransferase
MAIRPATASDADAIRELTRRAGAADDIAALIDDRDVRVLTQDSAVVGVLVLADGVDHLLIETALVDPARPGGGYVKALLAFAEQEARNRDHDAVRLVIDARSTDTTAVCRSLGYRELGPATVDGKPLLNLMKAL